MQRLLHLPSVLLPRPTRRYGSVLLCSLLLAALLALGNGAIALVEATASDHAAASSPGTTAEQVCTRQPSAEAPPTDGWQPVPRTGPRIQAGTCWFRWSTDALPDSALILQWAPARLEQARLFGLQDGVLTEGPPQRRGLQDSGSPWPSLERRFTAPVDTLLLQVRSDTPQLLPLRWTDAASLSRQALWQQRLTALWLGAAVLLALAALWVWVHQRQPLALWLLAWVGGGTLLAAWRTDTLLPWTGPLLDRLAPLWLPPLALMVLPPLTQRLLAVQGRLQRALALLPGLGLLGLLLAPFLDPLWLRPLLEGTLLAGVLLVLMAHLRHLRRAAAPLSLLHGLLWLLITVTLGLQMLVRTTAWTPPLLPDALLSALLMLEVMVLGLVLLQRVLRQAERATQDARQHSAAQLEQVRQQARNQAKGELLAALNHDIRSPVHGVVGLAEVLQRTDLNPQQRQCVDGIQRTSQSLLRVINDILDFSQIETGTLTLEPVSVALEDLLDDCVALFAEASAEQALPLHAFVDSRVPDQIRVDAVRVKQVLANLLSNAFKWTQQGQISVHVSLRQPPDAQGQCLLLFEVSDTGAGLDEHQKQELMSDDPPTLRNSGRHRGPGLGLAIARRLTRLLGGELGVNSAPGRGATFWFTVQCQQQVGRPPGEALYGKRLLVLDTSARFTLSVAQRATRWGMHVEDLHRLEDALIRLQAADSAPFDALVVGPSCSDRLEELPQALRPAAMLVASPPGTGLGPRAADGSRRLDLPLRARLLRQALVELLSPRSQAARSSLQTRLPQAAPTLRVLCVEHNPVNQLVLDSLLRTLGLRATLCAHGEQARSLLLEEDWDLVFLDAELPDLDAYGLCRQLRDRERRQAPPRAPTWVAAVSALATSDLIQKARDAGVDDCLARPVSREPVSATVERALERAMRRPGSPS